MQFDLGNFDDDDNKVEPTVNPSSSKVSSMSPVLSVTYLSGEPFDHIIDIIPITTYL